MDRIKEVSHRALPLLPPFTPPPLPTATAPPASDKPTRLLVAVATMARPSALQRIPAMPLGVLPLAFLGPRSLLTRRARPCRK